MPKKNKEKNEKKAVARKSRLVALGSGSQARTLGPLKYIKYARTLYQGGKPLHSAIHFCFISC